MRKPSLAALFVIFVLAGCTSGIKRPVTSVDAVPDDQGVQHVDVDLHSFYIKPNRIVVHAGRPVDLAIRNRSILVPHNFSVADSAISVDANKWGLGTKHVQFTPRHPGEYPFFCRVDAHSKKGMTGTLVVVP